MAMTEIQIFPEPLIEFRYGQKLRDPHTGLALFGPYDADSSSHPKTIVYGVVGTREGNSAFVEWVRKMNKPIFPGLGSNKRIWPTFPGFQEVFNCSLPETPAFTHDLDRERVLHASRNLNANERAYDVVEEYMKGISLITTKRDETFHVLICIVPDEVWKNCRPESRLIGGWGSTISKREQRNRAGGQTALFGAWSVDEYQLSVDFRRQLKARAMKYNVPLQIIRESTISGTLDAERRGLTKASDRAWNIGTAIYYKGGAKPWKLADARDGVCYIGISFRRTKALGTDKTACCAAQMFLDSGDGVVFLGDEGPWYSPDHKQYHLSKEASKKLLEGILGTYSELGGKELKEIFLHSRSDISAEEFQGYQEACPSGVKLVGIRVRYDRSIRAFRPGEMPIIRGTFMELNPKRGYLWASGFKPSLATYDGWEVPAPLQIDIQHGESQIGQVARDIFGLTKLNYNACKFGDSQPVTIGFSDSVGEILISNPTIKERSPKFKFYI